MYSFLCFLFFVGIFSFEATATCTGDRYLSPLPPPAVTDALFPLPSSFTFGSSTLYISQGSFYFSSPSNSMILKNAFARYENIIFSNSLASVVAHPQFEDNDVSREYRSINSDAKDGGDINTLSVSGLEVTVSSSDETLQYGIDESYTLNITAPYSTLTAKTVFGALRGLETFSQLITFSSSLGEFVIAGAPWIISDSPRYLHRGLLIDTSRHYLNVSTILRAIDGLAASKMNVLHWHLTDAQSFPLVTTQYPDLVKGSYTTKEVYSRSDLEGVVSYATDRGVRVVVEIDSPGHTSSWGVGYPNITVCRDKTREDGFCAENPCGMLDPSNPFTFEVIDGIVNELTQIFPDHFFHFGADEVVYDCWNTTGINKWMQDEQLKSYEQVFGYFEQQVHQIGAKYNRTPVNWEEVFDASLNISKDTIVQVWQSFAVLDSIVKAGYRAILSNYDAWYLDCGFGNWCPYCSWLDVYNNDPLSGSKLTPAEQALILGGEVCLWSEQVYDGNFDSRAWPRAAAAGERLWSPRSSTQNVPDAFVRILKHSCRLANRGLSVDPIIPGSNPQNCILLQE